HHRDRAAAPQRLEPPARQIEALQELVLALVAGHDDLHPGRQPEVPAHLEENHLLAADLLGVRVQTSVVETPGEVLVRQVTAAARWLRVVADTPRVAPAHLFLAGASGDPEETFAIDPAELLGDGRREV